MPDFSVQYWLDKLLMLSGEPYTLLAMLMALSLVTDSAAVIAAGVLVGQGIIPLVWAATLMPVALLVGDCAIYLFGYLARENDFIARHINEGRIAKLSAWLEPRTITVLALSRILPGSRSVIYLSFGYLRMPPVTFVLVAAATGFLWTEIILGLVAVAAHLFADYGTMLSLIAGVIAALLVLVPTHYIARRSRNATPPQA